jgi:glycogen operon protein
MTSNAALAGEARPERPPAAGRTMALGRPYPLGATVGPDGVNIAVFSEHATAIWLCVFDPLTLAETERMPLPAHTDGIWHGLLPGARAGLVYGLRADGPWEPERGQRFDPNKLLIDPYARRLAGTFRWTAAHEVHGLDNADDTYKAVACADEHTWSGDERPHTPMADTVLYEVHVKGFSARHPGIDEALRGTYEGLASDAAIAHFKRLGITALSLLPVHQSISERPLVDRGVTNYWGYNTLGFFAPDLRFARHDPVAEFRTMVRKLHMAGIEVILDVVFNHTAEGDHTGATLSFRGLDNANYYHLRSGNPALYENFTGTGNSVNLRHPRVLQMVMDSLRYWVQQMHVDGFRFDLATTLGRSGQHGTGFDAHAPFFHALRQDPVLAGVKMIAEPWDVAIGGYQVGRFPPGWSEWNDRYRNTVRAFWVKKAAYRGELAARLAGSSDLFRHDGRLPQATVNYLSSHDGFTLHDLVSYNRKHNEANGEQNADGTNDNYSWNGGIEGPTDLLAVNALRGRLKRSLLATLFMSQGVPMLMAGDELGRTQRGNNNAYNQDNELSWIDWANADQGLIRFTAWMVELRRQFPHFRRRRWLTGQTNGGGTRDVIWLNRQGGEMSQRQWEELGRFAFGCLLPSQSPDEPTLVLMLNGEAGDWEMPLPAGRWRIVVDTGLRDGEPHLGSDHAQGQLLLKARSLTLLESTA